MEVVYPLGIRSKRFWSSDKDAPMIYDEEITDILTGHAVRMLKGMLSVVVIGAIFCVALYTWSGWIPAIRAMKIPPAVLRAATAVRQAGVAVASAAEDGWVEANKEPHAQDRL
jgi:uncharacterized membrane protein YdbT with pleckstrin-like domain